MNPARRFAAVILAATLSLGAIGLGATPASAAKDTSWPGRPAAPTKVADTSWPTVSDTSWPTADSAATER